MKLSDVMSAADLAIYAEVGLVLFLVAFMGVVFRVLRPGREDDYERAVMIPLTDQPAPPRGHQPVLVRVERSSQEGGLGK